MPDETETIAQARRQIERIGRIPGLSDLILADTAAPGYGLGDNLFRYSSYNFGYTQDRRLAFLRAHGADPIDLPGSSGLVPETPLLNAPQTRDLSERWTQFRKNSPTEFQKSLLPALKSLPNTLRVWQAEAGFVPAEARFRPQEMPKPAASGWLWVSLWPGRFALYNSLGVRYAPITDGPAALARAIAETRETVSFLRASGIVLDLRPYSVSEVTALLLPLQTKGQKP